MIHGKALEAAHAGAELLDRLDSDWYQYVDETCLDITNERRCILGQRYKTFELGCAVMDLNMDGAIAHGFAPDPDQTDYDARMLEEVWGLEIRVRRVLDTIVIDANFVTYPTIVAKSVMRGGGTKVQSGQLVNS